MRTRLVLRPGQPGTRRLVAQYGDRLLCVRYRYDEQRQKRYTTVELIVSEADWIPPLPAPETIVTIRVTLREAELWRKVKAAGGRWEPKRKVWKLPYGEVALLGLLDRIVPDET